MVEYHRFIIRRLVIRSRTSRTLTSKNGFTVFTGETGGWPFLVGLRVWLSTKPILRDNNYLLRLFLLYR